MERLEGFFQTIARMQWSDYVDIALVALIIYVLMPLVRTPSTMRIAKSVIALLTDQEGNQLSPSQAIRIIQL